MEDVREALNHIDQDREALETILKGYEAWFRVNPSNGSNPQAQLSLGMPGRGGGPTGSISFKKGFIAVLEQARGEALIDTEIWRRMQEMGVVSNAQRPLGFIGLTAKRVPDAEKVAARTWRWKVSSTTT
jgi:hypothetical protein